MTTAPTTTTRPVILVRCRSSTDETAPQPVHLMPLPLHEHHDGAAVGTLCGVRLPPDEISTVEPGLGGKDWCTMCFTAHVTGCPAPSDAGQSPFHTPTLAGHATAVRAYTELGWPLCRIRDEIRLDLDHAVALRVPAILASALIELLVSRRCPPAVLAHPATPAHRIILAGERYPAPLPWPTDISRITSHIVLPPTTTAHGPVFWVRPPDRHSLHLCREIDVFTALGA